MQYRQTKPPRRNDKVSDPLRRAFSPANGDSGVESDLPDAFEEMLARMRGAAANGAGADKRASSGRSSATS